MREFRHVSVSTKEAINYLDNAPGFFYYTFLVSAHLTTPTRIVRTISIVTPFKRSIRNSLPFYSEVVPIGHNQLEVREYYNESFDGRRCMSKPITRKRARMLILLNLLEVLS